MKTFKIGEVIQAERKSRGITQSQLAVEMGISKSSVSKWETGQTYPDIYLLPELATYFSLTIDELLGYTPQLSREAIRNHYQRLSKAFVDEPFPVVMAECRSLIKKYYACLPFLLQMAVLLANHTNLAKKDEQIGILQEAIELTRRVKAEATDSPMIHQANSFEAACQMFLGNPQEVLMLLGEEVKPYLGNEQLMANAYKMLGQVGKSHEILQVSLYQQLMGLVSASGKLLESQVVDHFQFDQTVRRVIGISKLYNLSSLHPFLYVTFLLECFTGYTQQKRLTLALESLSEMIQVLETISYPATLHGDRYFDALDDWIDDQLELSSMMPRNEQLVKESLSGYFKENPLIQEAYQTSSEFKNLLAKLTQVLGV